MQKTLKISAMFMIAVVVTVIFKRFIPVLYFVPPAILGVYISKMILIPDKLERIIRFILNK
jgi:uncharacterized protein YqfA (UPF0365 family)